MLGYEEWEQLTRMPSFGRLLIAARAELGDLPQRDAASWRDGDREGVYLVDANLASVGIH